MQDASAVRTRKLYYEDAYQTAFSARVLSVEGNDVVLDQTLFFPEEGGQSPDRGVLAGRRVADVQIRDGEIHHILEEAVSLQNVVVQVENGTSSANAKKGEYEVRQGGDGGPETLAVGQCVFGRIDWAHRFSNMQQHSGEHLFSGLVHRHFGLTNVGFHCSDHEVTLDYDGPLTMEQLLFIEELANAAIVSNIPSQVSFLSGEEAKTAAYRSKLELTGEVRVVTFPGVDACACCAPHVARTGEIGCLKVLGVQNWKGGVRVNILCGKRAMAVYDRDHQLVQDLSRSLSTSPEEVFGLMQRMREEKAALAAKVRTLETRRILREVELLPKSVGSICLFEEELDQKAAQEAVNLLVSKAGAFAAAFIGNDREGYRYLIGTAHGDAREAAARLREAFGARGGGKPAMAQGFVKATEEEIRKVLC